MQGHLDQAIIFWSKQGLEFGYKYWLGGSGLAVTGCPSNSRLGGLVDTLLGKWVRVVLSVLFIAAERLILLLVC